MLRGRDIISSCFKAITPTFYPDWTIEIIDDAPIVENKPVVADKPSFVDVEASKALADKFEVGWIDPRDTGLMYDQPQPLPFEFDKALIVTLARQMYTPQGDMPAYANYRRNAYRALDEAREHADEIVIAIERMFGPVSLKVLSDIKALDHGTEGLMADHAESFYRFILEQESILIWNLIYELINREMWDEYSLDLCAPNALWFAFRSFCAHLAANGDPEVERWILS